MLLSQPAPKSGTHTSHVLKINTASDFAFPQSLLHDGSIYNLNDYTKRNSSSHENMSRFYFKLFST
jgi:hypothetical protein